MWETCAGFSATQAIVRVLDGINRYRFGKDPEALAEWNAAKHVRVTRSGRAGESLREATDLNVVTGELMEIRASPETGDAKGEARGR